ncbi:MAG: (2Fe-2S)-binding protein [Deltaproteobacteria bacterium]|nr:(2Fe-2S)-binding protein [Deltaproteobacteria bacterium]
MNSKKETIVCFCEDVTEDEIVNAIKQGFTRLVDIKNYLRPGMGPCQGRGCTSQIIKLVRQVTGLPPESILPLSHRPPITPVPIGVLSKIKKQEEMKR